MSQTLEISDEQYRLLQSLAQRQGATLPEALDHLLHTILADEAATTDQPTEQELAQSPLFLVAGIFDDDLPEGWADRHDEIIRDEVVNPHATHLC